MTEAQERNEIEGWLATPHGGRVIPASLVEALAAAVANEEFEAAVYTTMPPGVFVTLAQGLGLSATKQAVIIAWAEAKDAELEQGGGTTPVVENAREGFNPPEVDTVKDKTEAGKRAKALNSASQYSEDFIRFPGQKVVRAHAFSMSVIVGHVVAEHQVEGEQYGSEPALTDLGVQMRKSKAETLTTLVESKDFNGISNHMTSLIGDYNREGDYSAEVGILTGWWSALMETFGSDPMAAIAYIKAYLRKYRGRALPVELDVALVVKGMKSTDVSSVRADVKSLLAKVTKAESALEGLSGLKGQLNSLKSRVDKLESGKSTEEKQKGTRDKHVCTICGETGHWDNRCPQKKTKVIEDLTEE